MMANMNPDESERIQTEFIPTRRTLLSRLRNWDDRESWRDFFDTYWRLIYSVCSRSGLSENDAQDVVQETVLSVAKQMPGFVYDPGKGTFKAWLLKITQRRIADHYRKNGPWRNGCETEAGGGIDQLADSRAMPAGDLWDEEWGHNLMLLAIKRVKARVQPKHYQIFDLAVMKEWPAKDIVDTLHVSRAEVYLAKHRVSNLVRQEAKRLELTLSQSGRLE